MYFRLTLSRSSLERGMKVLCLLAGRELRDDSGVAAPEAEADPGMD